MLVTEGSLPSLWQGWVLSHPCPGHPSTSQILNYSWHTGELENGAKLNQPPPSLGTPPWFHCWPLAMMWRIRLFPCFPLHAPLLPALRTSLWWSLPNGELLFHFAQHSLSWYLLSWCLTWVARLSPLEATKQTAILLTRKDLKDESFDLSVNSK